MDYEKKYKEALERMKRWAEGTLMPPDESPKTLCTIIFPELAESEDERIRKELAETIRCISADCQYAIYLSYEQKERYLAWLEKQKEPTTEELYAEAGTTEKEYIANTMKQVRAFREKQKENPKSADSIPSDCVSNAKCEDRWYKVGDFLPDNGRDVLAKDALSNYLIAHYDGDQWFISGYDNEDKPIVYTPAIKEWCNIPSEKQKEQKPSWSEDERMLREFNDYLCEEIEARTNDIRDEKDRRTLNMLCYVLKKVDAWPEKQKELSEPEDTWLCARLAAKRLNKMELGVQFFGNLFPYLRKRGKLEGLCELGKQGKRPVWLYDTDGISDLVRKGKLEYNPR